jgi:hypothetical protein
MSAREKPLAVWLDWISLYLDDLDQRLTADERNVLLAALEAHPGSVRTLMSLPPDLMFKTQSLVAFLSLEAAPLRELIEFVVARLRLGREAEFLIVR